MGGVDRHAAGLVTVAEAAALADMTTAGVYMAVRRGRLTFAAREKSGRNWEQLLRLADVEAWMRRRHRGHELPSVEQYVARCTCGTGAR